MENYIIKQFKNKFIGDDAAIIKKWAISKDIFCENTHFKRDWLSYKQIGKKAMLVNISDAIVMNAKPKYALLGLSLPKDISKKEAKDLTKGINQVAKKYNIKIIGGDTTSSEQIFISITILAKIKKFAICRKKLKNGDLLCFTGKLGGSLRDLNRLKNGEKISKGSKFFEPILRDKFFYKASKYIKSAMDISDGLNTDLERFLKGRDLEFLRKLSNEEFNSGEEYEVLFAIKPKYRKRIEKIAKKTKTQITIFAKTKKGDYKSSAKQHF